MFKDFKKALIGLYNSAVSSTIENTRPLFDGGDQNHFDADGAAADTRAEFPICNFRYEENLREVRLTMEADVVADAVNYAELIFQYYDVNFPTVPILLAQRNTNVTGFSQGVTFDVMTLFGLPSLLMDANSRITMQVAKQGAGVALPSFTVDCITDKENN